MSREEKYLNIAALRFIKWLWFKTLTYLKYACLLLMLLGLVGASYFFFYKSAGEHILSNLLLKHSLKLVNLGNINNTLQINVSGANHTDQDEIITIAKLRVRHLLEDEDKGADPLITLQFVNSLKEEIEKLPWVSNVVVGKRLDNNLDIAIEEYQPFAIWHNAEQKHLINKDGKIIKILDLKAFEDLLIISGEGANLNVKFLSAILAEQPEIAKDVYYISWIGNRRWDIRFNNNLLVKLPEKEVKKSWSKLAKLYFTPGALIGLKVIDLRVEGKVYLEYGNQSILEVKSL